MLTKADGLKEELINRNRDKPELNRGKVTNEYSICT